MTNRINNQTQTTPSSYVGKLFVASPYVEEHPYEQAVALILQQRDNAIFGINLNQEADSSVVDAWVQATGKVFAESTMVQGGPLGGPVVAIHPFAELADQNVSEGLYLSTKSDHIDELIQSPTPRYRIAFGHIAWPIAQIQHEIRSDFWWLVDPDVDDIFDDLEEIWHNSIRRYGRQLIADVVGIKHFPESSMLN